jgi:cytosine/uracil/thiamine/allantoin permease
MVGSHFCHVCGTERLDHAQMDWTRYLDVQSIKAFFGLSTLTLAAFLVGIACLLAALIVGVVYNVQDYSDFQAVQFWRVEWLLGAVAAFVAGILLKQKA